MVRGDPEPWHDPERKPEYVQAMFGVVARRYDLLNSVLSFRRHHAWRRVTVRALGLSPGSTALDVCAGTCDLALELARAVGQSGRVVALDFCAPMLEAAVPKLPSSPAPVDLVRGDAMRLPFADGRFAAATVGFGIRNVAGAAGAVRELARVVGSGGRVAILEFAVPRNPVVRLGTQFYETRILPAVGALLSDRAAYTYLPRSIEAFHSRAELAETMRAAGLVEVRVRELNFGSVCLHMGTKP